MVVTDLHGDRDAFDRYVARFRSLYADGAVQRLVLLGDLIHGYGVPDEDFSISMTLDVMELQAEFGADNVIMLLGNHEMVHIYGVALFKGERAFSPRFEHRMGGYRARMLAFFERLPLVVRTGAGVLLTHAGPAAEVVGRAGELLTFDHRAILADADRALAEADDLDALYAQYAEVYGVDYATLAADLMAVGGPGDPRYPHLLRALMVSEQDARFGLLWDALFTQNEIGLSEMAHLEVTRQFLDAVSVGAPTRQRVVVSGHIVTPAGGTALVNRFHLRLSSATHARPREAGQYLLLDCARPVRDATGLLGGVGSVFDLEN
jgi:hypothetical protein